MLPTASFLERFGWQAVRGSEAVRVAHLAGWFGVPFLLNSAVSLSVGLLLDSLCLEWRFGVAASSFCFSTLPLASPQHTSAAPHAANCFFLEAIVLAGGSGV